MKTTKTIVASLILVAGFLCSCQSDLDERAKGYGYLQLSSVDVNKTMTRADVTATEQISVDVYDEENTLIEHADNGKTSIRKAVCCSQPGRHIP